MSKSWEVIDFRFIDKKLKEQNLKIRILFSFHIHNLKQEILFQKIILGN